MSSVWSESDVPELTLNHLATANQCTIHTVNNSKTCDTELLQMSEKNLILHQTNTALSAAFLRQGCFQDRYLVLLLLQFDIAKPYFLPQVQDVF